MIQPLLIALVAIVFIHDANPGLLARVRDRFTSADALGATLGACAGLALATALYVRAQARRLDRPRALRRVARAEMMLSVSRILAVGAVAIGVFVLGWLDAVRGVTGDIVLLDELIAITPALLVFIAGWWSFYPIERRLHDAMIVRTLDEGRPVYPAPTCAQFVLDRVRHQLLLILLPVCLLIAWTELLHIIVPPALRALGRALGPDASQALYSALQLLGAAIVFVFAPPLMRMVWSTVPLREGPLRDRLAALCAAHGVRVREMLVWRTHGAMINGAVMGIVGRFRYILLTDALLDSLPVDQIEAVMAHEVAHIRRRHLPWLVGAMLASVGVALMAILAPLYAALNASDTPLSAEFEQLASAGATIASLACALVVFGFVSRRFERQADAFAAQHLSGTTRANAGAGVVITPGAAEAMAGALQSVAQLNHVPVARFAWRHGSIKSRQAAVRALAGRRADRIPVDRTVRRVKLATAIALLATLAAVTADLLLPRSGAVAVDAPRTTILR